MSATQQDGPEDVAKLNEQVVKLYGEGKYEAAITLAERALAFYEKAVGPEHPHVATSLNNLAALYDAKGDSARAEPLYLRAIAIVERALGPDHPDAAGALTNLATLYYLKGDYSKAEPLYMRALTVREKGLGLEHPSIATVLVNLAAMYDTKGDYVRAEPHYLRALAIREKALGEDHLDVANLLNRLAALYHRQGEYAKAEPLYLRVIGIAEKALGVEHLDVAVSLNDLAGLYKTRGEYAKAEPLYLRSLTIREKALGQHHLDTAASLNNLATVYENKAEYSKAEPLYLRALAIREKFLGLVHPDVATSLNNLATLNENKGDYAEAEPYYLRSLAIREKALGPHHLDVANSLNNLAGLYKTKGEYARSEPLYLRALAIREKALGQMHPDVANSLNNLATLYDTKGDYFKAEPIYLRALAVQEKALGAEHPDVATTLNNLATLYYKKGEYGRAEHLYLRSLPIREKALGREHPDTASSLSNLGALYYMQGVYVKAEPLYLRAIAIHEKAFGKEHPRAASSLNNLAALYHQKGDYSKAEPLYLRAVKINEKAFGSEHPDIVSSLSNLADLYLRVGDHARALHFISRANDVLEYNLALILGTGSERQKLAYLGTFSGVSSATISMHTRSAPSDPKALLLALRTVLRRKGRALDATSAQVAALRSRLDPQDRSLLDELLAAQSQLSALVLAGPNKTPPSEHRNAITRLETEVERLQDSISRRSAEFRSRVQPVRVEQVQRSLPAGAALAEFFIYRPYDVSARTQVGEGGAPRYVAYVLSNEGDPKWADLGEAEGVDADVLRLLVALKCPQTVRDIRRCPPLTEVKALSRAVDERVMRPVRKLLGNANHVFISPDGALNLTPFAALVDESDKYLVETYTLTYLTSGRDLLRLQYDSASRQPPLVVADPSYGDLIGAPTTTSASPGRLNDEARTKRSADMGMMRFSPLRGTAEEAKALGPMLPGARILIQDQATEAALKEIRSPSVLHIATHGFFLPDQAQDVTDGGDGVEPIGGSSLVATQIENPLLRSGLALEGANIRRGANGEDGILTGLEVSAIDLWGTDLVVLSACETGVGEIRNGEGVYGLRRALVLAGSESQVISLWKVSDDATRDLMIGYYKRLIAEEGRTEALRQVQLEMLRSGKQLSGGGKRGLYGDLQRNSGTDYSHPFYWAAFIQSGDWRSIMQPTK